MNFTIQKTAKHKNKIGKAIDLYLKTIDVESSYTNTNQIVDYIVNQYRDDRIMFFYNLYKGRELYGFSEFGYLRQSQTLVIDYICTAERNPAAFGIFYSLTTCQIQKELQDKGLFIKYIVTEISLKRTNGQYSDTDSNYFRQMLLFEKFTLLNYPYYEPYFEGRTPKSAPFAIAIRDYGDCVDLQIDRDTYIGIITELYQKHYGDWFKKYLPETMVQEHIDSLLEKIKRKIVSNANSNSYLVNCPLFEEGKCKQVDIQPMTVGLQIKKRLKLYAVRAFLCCLTFLFAVGAVIVTFCDTNHGTVIAKIFSFLTLFGSGVTVISFLLGFLRK